MRQSTETFSSVSEVLLRSSISDEQSLCKKRLHVKIDLVRNTSPVKAIHRFKKGQQRDIVVVSSQDPDGNDNSLTNCSPSLHMGSGNGLPVLQTTQRTRSETWRDWEPDDSGFLSGTSLDHPLSFPSSSVISSRLDPGTARYVCENRTKTKTLSKKEMLLSKLRAQTAQCSSNSQEDHLTSERDDNHSDCTPVIAQSPSFPSSSSRQLSHINVASISGSESPLTNFASPFAQTPLENSGLPLKKRMFFGDHWQHRSSSRSGRESPCPSVVGSLITDPRVPSSSSSVLALPLLSNLMSSSSLSTEVSGAPSQIYEDDSGASSSSPPAKIGIVICRGRAMTLQDRQKMLAKCSSPNSESPGSASIVRPSASGHPSTAWKTTSIDPSQRHSESQNNVDAETRNFWWKKRSQIKARSTELSHSDTWKHGSKGKRCAIENESDPPKLETAKKIQRRVLRVRGNTPVNDTFMTT